MAHTILWFRKGLRLADNPALVAAVRGSTRLWPVFIFDPRFIAPGQVGINRMRFLLESLADLDVSLRRLGSRLFVLRGEPVQVLDRCFSEWQVSRLVFERDSEPYARSRDEQVRALATARGIRVESPVGHTLWDLDLLLSGGKPPLTYAAFQRQAGKLGDPASPLPVPTELPPPDPQTPEPIPDLAALGYAGGTRFFLSGGESAAQQQLAAFLAERERVVRFAKPETDPTAFDPPATTALSAHLKFGCLSARDFYHRLAALYREVPSRTEPPVSLDGQLLWREFFHTLGYAIPNYDRMAGNPICRQIPWDDDPHLLAAWREGRTGYPWIDAAMTQLRETGWLHHLARHAVACFLTRGDLWQSWEQGQAVFEQLLVDADWSLNASNWMWLSASAFFTAYHRVYSPVSFARKYDPSGRYVRRWLPVLAHLNDRYIYEPWLAPVEVQRAAGCLVGRDYPEPIVDHAVVRARNIERMRAAYAAT